MRIRELAHARPRFGYLRSWVLLGREGWHVNRKRIRRLHNLEGLQVPMRVPRRKHQAWHRGPAPEGPASGGAWISCTTSWPTGNQMRILTGLAQWSRESPILEPGFSLTGRTVATALDRVIGRGCAAPLNHS
jgi:putative transposase